VPDNEWLALPVALVGPKLTQRVRAKQTYLLCRTARKKRPSGLNFREAGNHKKVSITSIKVTAVAAAEAAAQLLGKAGADEVAEPPRTDLAGRVGATATKPPNRQHQ